MISVMDVDIGVRTLLQLEIETQKQSVETGYVGYVEARRRDGIGPKYVGGEVWLPSFRMVSSVFTTD